MTAETKNNSSDHQPLYLKYRPQKLSELVGQELIQRILFNSIVRNKLAHAYLLTGPRGCGKTSTARILAKSLNCKEQMSVEPCNKCINCLEISKSISPDVIEMDAASNRGVEDASRIIEKSCLAPQKSRFKIYILDEVHMLSNTAFNALLKTIEEPPKNVIFILATTEEHKVPKTIVSRCQSFSFRPIELEILKKHLKKISELEKIKISENVIEQISKQSKGALRDALSLLEQVSILGLSTNSLESLDIKDETVFELLGLISQDTLREFLALLQEKKASQALCFLDNLFNEGTNPLQFLRNFLEFSVETLEQKVIKEESAEKKDLIRIISKLFELENSLRITSNSSLKLKSAVVSICDHSEKQEEKISQVQINPPKEQIKQKKETRESHTFLKNKEKTKEKITTEQNIIELLIEKIESLPVKSLIKASKPSCLKNSEDKIILEIPQKVFYDKLKEKSRFEKIHQTLKEIKQNSDLVFEIVKSSAEISSDQISIKKSKTEKKTPEEQTCLKEHTSESKISNNTEELWLKAEYILGAKKLKD